MTSIRKNKATFRNRWSNVSKTNLLDALVSKNSPFGETEEGYVDFRGVCIDQSLHKITISEIDFSFCRVEGGGQFVSHVSNCLFDGGDIDTFLGIHFINCSFSRANIAEDAMTGKFESCVFDGANFHKRLASGVHFRECSFIRTDIRKANFYDCIFERCKLLNCKLGHGSLGGSSFIDCTIEGLDFSTTVMERVKGLDQ